MSNPVPQNGEISAIGEAPGASTQVAEFETFDDSFDTSPSKQAEKSGGKEADTFANAVAELATQQNRRKAADRAPVQKAPAIAFEDGDDDDEPAPKPPAKSPAKLEQVGGTTPTISESLRREAEEAGFTPDDIEDFTPSQLRKAIAANDRLVARQFRASKQTPVTPEPEATAVDEDDLSEDDFDPKLVKAFRKLRDENKALREAESRRAQERQVNELDAAFAALENDAWFGSGSGTEFDPDSREGRRRNAVIREANEELERYARRNQRPPAIKQLIAQAADAIYGTPGDKTEPTPRQRAAAVQPRRPDGSFGTVTARPSQKETVRKKGDAAALAGISEAFGLDPRSAEQAHDDVESSLL